MGTICLVHTTSGSGGEQALGLDPVRRRPAGLPDPGASPALAGMRPQRHVPISSSRPRQCNLARDIPTIRCNSAR